MHQNGMTRILVVDDEPEIRNLFQIWLNNSEYDYQCVVASNVHEALQLLQEETFQLILSDIDMPELSGIDLLKKVKEEYEDEIAVLLITGVNDRALAIKALEIGAYGYLNKPIDMNEMIINVVNALERRHLILKNNSYQEHLEAEVRERTKDVRLREEEISIRLVAAAEYRDEETGSHIRRMGLYAHALAKAMNLDDEFTENIRIAAPMHDIGKIGVSDRILCKPGPLTAEEFELVKHHTHIGACILEGSDIKLLNMAKEIAMYHHEWWNGNGYPQGLMGEDIPLAARIVAIADVYDALINKRVYKPALPEEKVLEIMKSESGTHFDPKIFSLFLDTLPEFHVIQQTVKEEKDLMLVQEA